LGNLVKPDHDKLYTLHQFILEQNEIEV